MSLSFFIKVNVYLQPYEDIHNSTKPCWSPSSSWRLYIIVENYFVLFIKNVLCSSC